MVVAQAWTVFTQDLTGAAKSVSVPSTQGMSTISSAWLIESRSKLYKQLSELQNKAQEFLLKVSMPLKTIP